jgi:hypothetical protein
MDIIMPDVAAQPYLNDLKLLGKINHGARNGSHKSFRAE